MCRLGVGYTLALLPESVTTLTCALQLFLVHTVSCSLLYSVQSLLVVLVLVRTLVRGLVQPSEGTLFWWSPQVPRRSWRRSPGSAAGVLVLLSVVPVILSTFRVCTS